MSREALRWTALALAGLIIAGGVTLAISRLTSQDIGIAQEPLSAGRELAPTTTTRPPGRTATVTTPARTVTVITPTRTTTTATAPTTTSDDHGRHGDGDSDDD